MVFDRRSVVGGGITFLAVSTFDHTFAQTDAGLPAEGMEKLDDFPPGFQDGLFRSPDPNKNFGATPPPEIYNAIGSTILRGAPVDCRPIDVAFYFTNLREGVLPPAVLEQIRAITAQANQPLLSQPGFLKFFAYDWEQNHYYNPVVIGFFRGNGLNPYAGDETPWCAAFANWCISRSRARQASEIVFSSQIRATGTQNASSGSFRCWGTATTSDPREGDVIVWAKVGTVTGKCPTVGQGHVAFVEKVEVGSDGKRRYQVVGGNQGFRGNPAVGVSGGVVRPQDVAQAVSRRVIGSGFSDRVLHSVRTAAFLR
jgi:hypothetical protein